MRQPQWDLLWGHGLEFCCWKSSVGRVSVSVLRMPHKPRLGCWNRIHCQKAHESSFPTICLPNGNVFNFSHTNRKHFTVGDPMTFPIVKMENKPHPVPQKSPLPVGLRWSSSNTAVPRPTASTTPDRNFDGWGTVAHVGLRRKVPIGYTGAPQVGPQKYPLPWTDCQTTLHASSLDQRDLWCQTASGSDPPLFHNAPNRPFTGKFDDYSPLCSESDAA